MLKYIYTNGASVENYEEGYLDDDHMEAMINMYEEDYTKPRDIHLGHIIFEDHLIHDKYMVGLYIVRSAISEDLRFRCIVYHKDDEYKRLENIPFKHITCFSS